MTDNVMDYCEQTQQLVAKLWFWLKDDDNPQAEQVMVTNALLEECIERARQAWVRYNELLAQTDKLNLLVRKLEIENEEYDRVLTEIWEG